MPVTVKNRAGTSATTQSVHPFGQIVAALQLCSDLRRGHVLVLGQVLGVLPFEELDAVLGHGLTAKVAVGRSLLVLGFSQGERHGNGARAAVEGNLDDIGDVLRRERTLFGPVSLQEERQRLRNTNGIRELHQSTLAQATLHHGLGHLAADVSCRAIDLGGVLSREGTAAMRTPASVGVDDDLAAREAGITLRPANDELAGGVDVQVSEVAKQ
mmetsp:Transcript_69582/g.161217  ORF Transcript_69582/g.161217 Transcript_69582/m.161217 type:complete len:213 (-) Transcript_69582:91-729(-)